MRLNGESQVKLGAAWFDFPATRTTDGETRHSVRSHAHACAKIDAKSVAFTEPAFDTVPINCYKRHLMLRRRRDGAYMGNTG